MKLVIDGDGAVLGRVGSFVAKELLKGNEVVIVNSENVIISGSKKDILQKVVTLRQKGGNSLKGPQLSKLPDRFLKRKIRGMLPWDKAKGRAAFKRLRCYVGVPLKDEEMKDVKKMKVKKPLKFLTIKQIADYLK